MTYLITTPVNHSLFDRYSSWSKLFRITARCLRWKHKQNRVVPLTTGELTTAHNKLIRLLQNNHFSKEISILCKDRDQAVKGKLTRLNPFIDRGGILRVGSRLSHLPMPFAQKRPIILPKSSVTACYLDWTRIVA